MASIKTCFSSDSEESQTLKVSHQKRESFERFGEDLSQLILQYLPQKQRKNFKLVSKDFERNICEKQDALIIRCPHSCYKICKVDNFDLEIIESLLKKCPNIRSVVLPDSCSTYCNNDQFIQLIIQYCDTLVKFDGSLNGLSVDTFNKFKETFGSKLRFLNVIEVDQYFQLITSCSNIETLSANSINDFNLVHFKNELLTMPIHNLKAIKLASSSQLN